MHRILAYLDDEELVHLLEQAARQAASFEVVVTDQIDQALTALAQQRFSAVLVGPDGAELPADEREQLLSAGGHAHTSVWAVGQAQFDELHASAHLGEIDDLEQFIEQIEQRLERAHGMSERPDSSTYFVADTQGRPFDIASESDAGLAPRTSQVEVDAQTPARLLYVGGPGEFRNALDQSAGQADVEMIVVDTPAEVVVRAGDPAIDLAVLAVDFDLSSVRRLIRYLRGRQPQAPFDVLLLADADDELGSGLARSFGADAVLSRPVDPARVLSRLRRRKRVESTDMLVVTSAPERVQLFKHALAREPVDAVYASEPDNAVDIFASVDPEIVVVDEGDGDVDVAGLVERLQRDHPFAATRYLGVLGTGASRSVLDDAIVEPVLPADIRRIVRLHLARASYGRAQLERDRLTDVNSTLALADDLQASLDMMRDTDTSVVLTGVDVDDLDKINERYGRAVGDSVLRSLADALHVAVGERSALYRTDADEFFVLQHSRAQDWPQMRARLERALRVFQQQTFRAPDGRGTYATASAGAVVIPPADVSAEVCLQKCWIVLERASSALRNRLLVAMLDPSMVSTSTPARDLIDGQD